jgi:hypothetical protein
LRLSSGIGRPKVSRFAEAVDSGANFSWLIRNHRLSKDYERMVQSSETFIEVAMIRLMLRRLGRGA